MAKKILLLTCSVLFVFGMFELGFRVMGYEAIYETYSKPSKFWQADPQLGWVHSPGAEGVYVGPRPFPVEFETPIKINSIGLRGPELAPVPPGGFRVLVTGDSHVAAFEVPYHQTFTALLEGLLSERLGVPVQVVNAGIRGYGSDQALIYFRKYGRALDPDLVLQVHSTNDPRNNITIHRMRRPFGKGVFRLVGESIELSGTPVGEFPICSASRLDRDFDVIRIDGLKTRIVCRLQLTLFDHSALFTFITVQILNNPAALDVLYKLGAPEQGNLVDEPTKEQAEEESKGRYDHRLTAAILREFAIDARESGARFVISGQGMQYLDLSPLEALDVPILDRNLFLAGIPRKEIVFKNDSHFNTRGHRIRAEALAPILEQELRKLVENQERVARQQDLDSKPF